MRKFKQNKLWRDKSVENLEKSGSIIHWHRLNDDEFKDALGAKLIEEASEVFLAKTKTELINELADVFEVIDTMLKFHDVTFLEIQSAQRKKFAERGGFVGRMFVEVAEHPPGSEAEQYCLADAQKYPELSTNI